MAQGTCSCTGNTLDRFLRPCVMAVLAAHPGGLHGYLVAQHLKEVLIFANNPPDMTGLYRVLRAMEAEGYLAANWDVQGLGAARRIYALSHEGHSCLRQWKLTLERYAIDLQSTLDFIDKALGGEVMTTSV